MSVTKIITLSLILLTILVTVGMIGCPQYKVYSSKKEGEALLAHAQASKEVAVAEAKAKMESAIWLYQADSIRAIGIAKSNQIIGLSLKDNPQYLTWLWIDGIDKNKGQTIYIPTEANMPILEAGKGINKE